MARKETLRQKPEHKSLPKWSGAKKAPTKKIVPKKEKGDNIKPKAPSNSPFVPGNRWWELRSSAGIKPIFSDPDVLWGAACEYFDYVEEHPLEEEKGFAFQGVVTKEKFKKMRAMTLEGLCLFLDISTETWRAYRKSEVMSGVVSKVENVIRTQKFEGAAADLLNPNIIARDLGLNENLKQTLQNPDGSPLLYPALVELPPEDPIPT